MPLPLIPLILGAAALFSGGYGAKKGYDAYCDNEDAKDYTNKANEIKRKSYKKLDEAREETNASLTEFGKYKMAVFENQLKRFVDAFSKIKNFNERGAVNFNEQLKSKEISFKALKRDVLDTADALGSLAGGAAAGAAAGFGALGGVTGLASAGTGTAISALSGVAAQNATLAWLGGGTLASGGLGVAGGTMVLGGLIAGPALAVAGWVLSSKAETAKNNAHIDLQEARAESEANDNSILKLRLIIKTVSSLRNTIDEVMTILEFFRTA